MNHLHISFKKQRESNIELIRSISMFMILLLHANFVALPWSTIELFVASPLIQYSRLFLESLCIVSVSIFVYISGWFRVRTNVKSILYFYFQIIFFWGVVYFLLVLFGYADFSLVKIGHSIAFRHSDWFVKAYAFLFVLAPILNVFIDNVHEKTFRYTLFAFFISSLCKMLIINKITIWEGKLKHLKRTNRQFDLSPYMVA